MSQHQPRRRAGRPEGGQYATTPRAETDLDLAEPAPGLTPSWSPTPEDPSVQWTQTVKGMYATVSELETVVDRSADYDVPHPQPGWMWEVATEDGGDTLASGVAASEADARASSEAALASHVLRKTGTPPEPARSGPSLSVEMSDDAGANYGRVHVTGCRDMLDEFVMGPAGSWDEVVDVMGETCGSDWVAGVDGAFLRQSAAPCARKALPR